MEPAARTLANGTIFEDRYEILGELGSGSFARVYLARQRSTGQSVAIKLLSEREGAGHEVERFRREMEICAALSHPNIVGLIDSGETAGGRLYAVFEHVPGETLAQALEREGALSVRESVRLMTQVLEALAEAHTNGIVHRDLKPENLMLSSRGVRRSALVLDFGLGTLVAQLRHTKWETLSQSGTPITSQQGTRATWRSNGRGRSVEYQCMAAPLVTRLDRNRLVGNPGGQVILARLRSIWRPERFHLHHMVGRGRSCFEGWYFKLVDAEGA